MNTIKEMFSQIDRQGHGLTDKQRHRYELIRLLQSELVDVDIDLDNARSEVVSLERRRAKVAEQLTALGVKVDP